MSKTYAQARKTPKGGWAHTEDREHLNAAMSDILGMALCMQPKAIYKWATKQGVDLQEHILELRRPDGQLLIAVLNDWSLEETRARLA